MTSTTNTRTCGLYPLGRRNRLTDDIGLTYSRPTDDDLEPAEIPADVELRPLTGRARREVHR